MVTCIVADDEEHVLSVFSELLEMLSVDVVSTAKNGYDALQQYKKFKPDMIFLDLLMPEYDGVFASKKILEHDPAAKIIIVTGYVDKSESELLDTLNISKVIYKPFTIEEIRKTITDIFKKS